MANRITWTYELIKETALKYDSRKKFQLEYSGAYKAARKLGIVDEIFSHFKSPHKTWVEKDLYKEALKYSNRTDFSQKSSGAYQASRNMGIVDHMCLHMDVKIKNWKKPDIFKEALKYKTRIEFKNKNKPCYRSAHYYGIIDEVCGHMKFIGGTSIAEQTLMSEIKKVYPKAITLRDRKVKIEGKPHIKGFDLDIYIPELRKAIEFDGDYWHSTQGLRRSRNHWPDEDVENYHEIKDEYFKNKGIDVLHVADSDWKDNKIEELNKCLKFLNIQENSR